MCVLNMMLEEIANVRTKLILMEELDRIKSRIVNGFVFCFEISVKVLSEYLDLWQDRFAVGFLEIWSEKLKVVKLAELGSVLGDLFDKNYWVVVVGNEVLKVDLVVWVIK